MGTAYQILSKTDYFYFHLRAGNNEIILRSQEYDSKQGCENGIDSVRIHSPYDSNYELLTSNDRQYYFNLRSANNKIIGTSETYITIQGRDEGIESVKLNGPTAPIEDLTI